MINCSKCLDEIAGNDAFVVCYICKRHFDAKCSNISKTIMNNCKSSSHVKYFCVDCVDIDFDLNNHIKNLMDQLKAIPDSFSKFFEKVENLISFKINEVFINNPTRNLPNLRNDAGGIGCETLNPSYSAAVVSNNENIQQNTAGVVFGSDEASSEIMVAPIRKSVFLSRLGPQTTELNLTNHLKSKLNTDTLDIQYQLLIPKSIERESLDYISYKLRVNDDLYEKLLSPGIWPVGVLVKPFVNRNHRKSVGFIRQQQQQPHHQQQQ